MKKIYLILVLSLPLSMFAQSKFSVEANSSSMVIKGDAGLVFGVRLVTKPQRGLQLF